MAQINTENLYIMYITVVYRTPDVRSPGDALVVKRGGR
jgi:hypothetical protein